jgi:hypothetical protein
LLVPVTVLPRPPPGTTHVHVKTVLELQQSACSSTHETRQRCVFRREGICVDRSAINLDTSTESRSPVKTFGRFSFRGPCRLARKMAVRETRLTRTPSPVKTYPKACGHFSTTTRPRPNAACLSSYLSRWLMRRFAFVGAGLAPPVRWVLRQHIRQVRSCGGRSMLCPMSARSLPPPALASWRRCRRQPFAPSHVETPLHLP